MVGRRATPERRAQAPRSVLRRCDRRRRLYRAQRGHHARPRRPRGPGLRQNARRRGRLLAERRHRQRQPAALAFADDPALRQRARHGHASRGQGRTRGPRSVHRTREDRLRLSAHRTFHRRLEPRPVRPAAARGRGPRKHARHRGLRARSRTAARRARHRLLLGRSGAHGHRRAAPGQAACRDAPSGRRGRCHHPRRDRG